MPKNIDIEWVLTHETSGTINADGLSRFPVIPLPGFTASLIPSFSFWHPVKVNCAIQEVVLTSPLTSLRSLLI